MFKVITGIFNKKTAKLEQQFLTENNIKYDEKLGYIVDGFVVNQFSERLQYLSNRRMHSFDDLAALYLYSMIINEKIDLEIASKKFEQRLGNTEENLLQFKNIIKKLNLYYRQFLRDKV
jgi:hypothetical protein